MVTLLLGVLLSGCGGSTPPAEEPPPAELGPEDDTPDGGGAVAKASSSAVQDGINAIQAQDFDKAKQILSAAHESDPKDAQAAFYLGVAQENTDDVDAAIASYRKALENDPKLAEAAVNLSAILLDKQDYVGALEVTEAALGGAPKNSSLLVNRAIALSGAGKSAEALKAYADAVAAAPDALELRYEYAQALAENDKKQEAIEQLKQVMRSPDPAVVGAAANLLGRLGAFAECIAGLDKALNVKKIPDLFVRRGACRHGMKDDAGALKDYKAAVEADESFAAGHYYLGRHYLATGKKKEAKQHLNKTVELGAGTPLEAAAKKVLAGIK
jgi:tetratricopeptide (TPR) repeat protein